MKKVKFGRVVSIALLALLAIGCSGKKEAASTVVEYKTVLNVAGNQESPSLDLHKNSSLIARRIGAGTIWEKLVTLNSRSEVVPELAERFELSPDGATLTFYLRRGVKFHDGTTMTAEDVVASMNRWIESFSSAKQSAGAARFVKVDDATVRITFDHPAVTFPDVMAGAAQPAVVTTAIACADEDDKGFMKQNIGTGPFKFVEWKLDQYILLERFADYVPYGDPSKPVDGWAGYKAPKLEQIYFHYVPQSTTRVAGLETGQFDVNLDVDDDNIPRLKSLGNIEMVQYQAGTLAFVFNKKEGLASNVYFRQAVNAAINCDDVLASIYGSQWSLGSCYMDDTQPFWASDAGSEHYNRQDLNLVKELLAKANYKGEPFRILSNNVGASERGVLVFEQNLKAAGINVVTDIVDWATMMSYRTDSTRYDIYTTSFVSVPVPSLKLYFGSAYPGWTDDPTLAKYFEDFNAAPTREEAKRRWDILQGYSWEYLPLINVGHFNYTHAWNEKVENVTAFGGLYFWNTSVRK